MFHVITGGSGSGKSAYAEACIVQLHKKHSLYYIATMMPFGKEMEAKIDRHRRMRAGKGFETVECFNDLHLTTEKFFDKAPDVLLECMSNLVANEWFDFVQKNESEECFTKESMEQVIEKIWQGVQLLQECCEHLVIVTNEVFSDGARGT